MKSHPKVIDRIIEKIRQSQSICVVGHLRPDGDCIGSQLAFALALRKQGKDVVCWNQDRLPEKYAFLDPTHVVQQPEGSPEFDLVIALDCASFERLGTTGLAVEHRKYLINVDHHQSNTRYGDLNWISDREASTGELVFRILRVAEWPITAAMADCLFTAVSTDTGSFQYPTTKPVTYHTAGELVKLGADLGTICDEVYQSFPLSRVRLLKHLYNHFHLTYHDRIAYLWLKIRDFTRTGSDSNDTEGLIDHIRAFEPVVVACVFEEVEPELTRISLRSKSDDVNVNDIAAQFGGGGHRAAAGARVAGKPLAVQRRVIAAIKKALAAAHEYFPMQPFDSFDGAVLIDKPAGPTSHDIVDAVRRNFGLQKVGHCGTLDPNATGLLILVLGRGTKLSEKLMGDDKIYEGSVKFGESTDSYDAAGELTGSLPVPPMTLEEINEAAATFQGDQMQMPPMVSAVKVQGVPLYKMARKGIEVERKARLIHVYSFRFSSYAEPIGWFRVACTKGTYVRALAHELGAKLGPGGHLASLRRIASGKFNVKDAIPFEDLIKLPSFELEKRVVPFLQLTQAG